jgi:DNA-directed RNA polymerase subunit M/transcription elongation factor TFIIS
MLSEIKKKGPTIKKPKVIKKTKEEKQQIEEKDFFREFLEKNFTSEQLKRIEVISEKNKTDIYEITGLILELKASEKKEVEEIIDILEKDAESPESLIFNNEIMRRERERFIMEDKISREKIVLQEGGLFKCPKCSSTAISTTQRQMRSADEPMTTFFNCTICGYSWKD